MTEDTYRVVLSALHERGLRLRNEMRAAPRGSEAWAEIHHAWFQNVQAVETVSALHLGVPHG